MGVGNCELRQVVLTFQIAGLGSDPRSFFLMCVNASLPGSHHMKDLHICPSHLTDNPLCIFFQIDETNSNTVSSRTNNKVISLWESGHKTEGDQGDSTWLCFFLPPPSSLTPEVVVGADSPWIPRSWKVVWMVNFFLDVSLSQGGWGTFRWALRTRGCLEGSGVWTEERSEILNMHPSWPDNPGEENPWAPLSSGIKGSIFPYTFIGLFSFQRVSTFMSGSILLLTSWVNHVRNSILFYRRENGGSDILPLLHCLMSFTTSVSRCFLQAESESITNPFVTSVNLRCGRSRDSSTQLISLNSEQLYSYIFLKLTPQSAGHTVRVRSVFKVCLEVQSLPLVKD